MQPPCDYMVTDTVPLENVADWQAKVLGSKHDSQEVGWPVDRKRFLRIFLGRVTVVRSIRDLSATERTYE